VSAPGSLGSIVLLSAVALAVAGCDDDTDLSGTLEDGGSDAPAPSGPMITVTTTAPARGSLPPAKASATWAAYRVDDADWHSLAPASEGAYSFPLGAARWTLALVCASADDALATIYVHHRTNLTPAVDLALDEACTPPPPPAEYALTGTLTNLPSSTQWFDFGYAHDSRGEAIPVSGTTGTYEIVGIEPGMWDLSFAVRDEPSRPITRFVVKRGVTVSRDATLDVDLAGPGSFAPGSSALRLHALLKGDTVTPVVLYGAGGPSGIDVGPQEVPDGQPDVTLAYSTVPSGTQLPSDRYHGELKAEQDRRTGSRVITFDVHQAIDLDLTFLPDPAPPQVAVVGTSPYVRLATKLAVLPGGQLHEIMALAAKNRRTQVAWRSTYDAHHIGSATELEDVTPDLSAVPGWRPAWGLPAGITTTVLAMASETPRSLGDGTTQRSASKGTEITP
jgi:hypothetical protein